MTCARCGGLFFRDKEMGEFRCRMCGRSSWVEPNPLPWVDPREPH